MIITNYFEKGYYYEEIIIFLSMFHDINIKMNVVVEEEFVRRIHYNKHWLIGWTRLPIRASRNVACFEIRWDLCSKERCGTII